MASRALDQLEVPAESEMISSEAEASRSVCRARQPHATVERAGTPSSERRRRPDAATGIVLAGLIAVVAVLAVGVFLVAWPTQTVPPPDVTPGLEPTECGMGTLAIPTAGERDGAPTHFGVAFTC